MLLTGVLNFLRPMLCVEVLCRSEEENDAIS